MIDFLQETVDNATDSSIKELSLLMGYTYRFRNDAEDCNFMTVCLFRCGGTDVYDVLCRKSTTLYTYARILLSRRVDEARDKGHETGIQWAQSEMRKTLGLKE